MSNYVSSTLINKSTVITGDKTEALDLLDYSTLELELRVRVPANAGITLEMQHSAVNDDECFDGLGTALGIASADDRNQTQSYSNFLRYVRLIVNGTVTTQPTLTAVVVAKGV